jgi:intracellular multiplication protein IcmT
MSDTHWRNSMKPARFFFLDARAAVPFVVCLLHLRWYTLVFAAMTTLMFYILETRGLNFVAALRAFRVWLVTRKRPNVKHSDRTRLVDYGFEPPIERVNSEEASSQERKNKRSNSDSKVVNERGGDSTNQNANHSPDRTAGVRKAKTVKPTAGGAIKN